MNTTNAKTAPLPVLTNGQRVKLFGRPGFYAVFTVAGYTEEHNRMYPQSKMTLDSVQKSQREHNLPERMVLRSATVMTAERDGMKEWATAPTVRVGDAYIVEGVVCTLKTRAGLGDDFALEPQHAGAAKFTPATGAANPEEAARLAAYNTALADGCTPELANSIGATVAAAINTVVTVLEVDDTDPFRLYSETCQQLDVKPAQAWDAPTRTGCIAWASFNRSPRGDGTFAG